jgi:cytochrome c
MTNSSDTHRGGFLTKRRATLLLIGGALAGLVPRAARSGSEPQTQTTRLPIATADAGFPDLKRVGPARQVRAIGYSDGIFRVTTRDGQTSDFWEQDLRLKIDSSSAGPHRGAPVILSAGTMGDRAWVLFAAPEEISTFIKKRD